MGIINNLIRLATSPAYNSFVSASKNLANAQEQTWREVNSVLSRSQFWGAKARNRKLDDFKITDYETYREEINRLQSQTVSSFSGDKIIYWAESGGTSGPAKLFPLTENYQKQFQRTMPPYLHANATRFPGFADKPVIYLASLLPQRKTTGGIDIGYISIFNYQKIPAPLKKLYVFPSEIFANAERFKDEAPVLASASDISAIFAITPAKVEQFWNLIWSDRDRVIRALHQNKQKLRVSDERIKVVEKVFSMSSPTFADFWPGLKMIGCWKTSSCALQLEALQSLIQHKTPVADAVYSATEGWVTVPIYGESGGVLHGRAHVVEFHEAGGEPSEATLLKPWQLEAGKEYEIFLTTAMGFVRYRLYDVLHCSGFFNQAPVLEFKRKAGSQISLGTMRVTEDELLLCMKKVGFSPKSQFRYAPNSKGNGLLFVAQNDDPSAHLIQAKIHGALQELSFYYRRDVRDGVIKQIEVLVLPESHSIWKSSDHAQEKPKILLQEYPRP